MIAALPGQTFLVGIPIVALLAFRTLVRPYKWGWDHITPARSRRAPLIGHNGSCQVVGQMTPEFQSSFNGKKPIDISARLTLFGA